MRQHPKWTDARYWAGIAERCVVLEERERERLLAAARKQDRLRADVERFLAKQRGEASE